jgi:hypothetical protein
LKRDVEKKSDTNAVLEQAKRLEAKLKKAKEDYLMSDENSSLE